MDNIIGSTLVTALATTVTVTLEEDAAQSRPYAVYSVNVIPQRTKAGVYKLSGDMSLTIYADTYNGLKDIVATSKTKIEQNFAGAQLRAALKGEEFTCIDGFWSCAMNYSVAQYSVPSVTTNDN